MTAKPLSSYVVVGLIIAIVAVSARHGLWVLVGAAIAGVLFTVYDSVVDRGRSS